METIKDTRSAIASALVGTNKWKFTAVHDDTNYTFTAQCDDGRGFSFTGRTLIGLLTNYYVSDKISVLAYIKHHLPLLANASNCGEEHNILVQSGLELQ